MPRAIELPTPIYGYTGEKRKEIIKGEKIDRSKRPITKHTESSYGLWPGEKGGVLSAAL